MSRAAKWKVDKNKVKVVFRLQFHGTHIPQTGWNNLFISLVPVETGKATAKTNKASVRNGSCKWADPIYETTRLLQDSKTKQFEEKIYKLLVAMGTSRSSLLGEASINLSDYVDALKPTVVALPLQGNDSGATLHVTVQLLTSKTGFREFEQQREVSDSGLQTNSDHTNGKLLTTGDAVVSRLDKVNPRLKVKPDSKELPSLEKESGISEDYADSGAGFDGSSNTSGSLCAEKHEISSCREIDSIKSAISGEPGGISPTQSPRTDKGATDHRFLQGGTSEWIRRWGAENSTNSEIAIVYEENHRLREALEVADVSIHELRKEISSLQTCAEDIGVEAQNLTKKISIEIAADQELVKEISLLKSECSRFKDDLEWLKTLKLKPQIPKTVDTDQCNVIQDMSMRWIKGLQVAEDKIKEVQEKVHLGFNGKDSMLLHTDLEALLSILQDLKRGTEGCIYQFDDPSSGKAKTSSMLNSSITDHVIADTGLGVELCHPEGVLLPGLLASGASSVDPTNAMQGEIFKLLRELDESKSEKEGLLRKMDQMECYYEALIQELEENQKQILGELQSLRNEHSSCIYTVSSTKAQMEAIHQQMSNELLQLAEERCNLDALNKELERRALASEAALRRARLNYSIAVNQLQKDLGVLSLQVHSMYETNENLIRRTFSEASEPLLQGSQDAIPTSLAEDSDLDKVMVSQSHNSGIKSQLLGSDILLEDLKRSLVRQEELIGKIQEEVSELLLANVYLDVFSVTLLENLVEAASRSKLTEVEMCELSKHLEFSSRENETLKVKLQNMTDHLVDLSEEKVSLVSRCNDLVVKNEKLEANLSSISHEKLALDVKIGEMGNLLSDYKSYKNNYEICNAEKLELANLLELATAEKGNLSKEVSLLQEELRSMKNEISSKELLQNIVDYLREKLENLLVHGNEQIDDTLLGRTEDMKDGFKHFKTIMLQLEKFHQKLHDKICVLVKEKEDLLNEHDVAKLSLASASTEVEVVKQKFQHDLEDMVNKLDESTTLVEDLQRNLVIVGEKLKLSTEAEEKYMRMTQDLLSDFTKMDASLEDLNFKCKDLAEETMALGSVTEELIGSKLTIDRITQENLDLNDSLLNKTNESSMLKLELDNLKGNVGSLQDELYLLRGIRDKLEADVLNLNAELKGRDERLTHLVQQNAEIIQLKQLISDMELEKASLCQQLSNYEENLKKESVGFTALDLEIQLVNMHEFVIASDVTCAFIMKQYKDHAAELLHHLEYSNQQCLDLKKKNFDLTSTLNSCIARNEIFAEENSTLLSNLQSLRSELESYVTLNRDLEQTISEKAAELEEYKNEKDLLKTSSDDAIAEHQCDVRDLKSLLGNCQKENDDLIIQKEETEIRVLMLKALVEEMSSNSGLHEECSEHMTMLKKQCSDLTRKLSEQVLKTEEFKNLSIHLKELKDKSVEKKEAEGSSVAMQESLRIAFIKEQCETKIQELKYQLSISKKHGEEMLWKLQDALDELETRKKREASQLKRNEELLSKIVELEAELQSVLSENRERFMAYEQLKAELDCSVMSLDCCKEEKKQLMASLQESNVENSRLTDEIELMREQIENMKFFMTKPTHNEDGCHIVQTGSNELSDFGNLVDNSPLRRREALDEGISRNSSDDQANHLSHCMTLEIESHNEESMNLLAVQDALVTKATEDSSRDSEHAAPLHDQMKGKTLLACIERLQKELDVMRNENTLLEHENANGLDSEGLQREQMHLQKVSKELGDLSSLYNDSSRSGNSVERVLALELELAEALQAKKSTVQFQSSFLKLHSDEAAVFQSFRDINELIKDMLEMKERYGTLEAQLKEMHERYSQLSLDFAEVEGERQKLTMTLKNVRPSKRLLSWPQSSSHKVSSP